MLWKVKTKYQSQPPFMIIARNYFKICTKYVIRLNFDVFASPMFLEKAVWVVCSICKKIFTKVFSLFMPYFDLNTLFSAQFRCEIFFRYNILHLGPWAYTSSDSKLYTKADTEKWNFHYFPYSPYTSLSESYFGDVHFESRPGQQLSWHRFFGVFFTPLSSPVLSNYLKSVVAKFGGDTHYIWSWVVNSCNHEFKQNNIVKWRLKAAIVEPKETFVAR